MENDLLLGRVFGQIIPPPFLLVKCHTWMAIYANIQLLIYIYIDTYVHMYVYILPFLDWSPTSLLFDDLKWFMMLVNFTLWTHSSSWPALRSFSAIPQGIPTFVPARKGSGSLRSFATTTRPSDLKQAPRSSAKAPRRQGGREWCCQCFSTEY